LPLVAERPLLRRLAPEAEDVRALRLQRPLRHGVLGWVRRVGRLQGAATHTGETAAHGLGDLAQLVRVGVEPRLVHQGEGDRVAEAALCVRRHYVDATVPPDADE